MKLFIALALVANFSYAAPKTENKKVPAKKEVAAQNKAKPKQHPLTKKEEDCDDKAKKPIEIKEETISLGGNTGCTLEE